MNVECLSWGWNGAIASARQRMDRAASALPVGRPLRYHFGHG